MNPRPDERTEGSAAPATRSDCSPPSADPLPEPRPEEPELRGAHFRVEADRIRKEDLRRSADVRLAVAEAALAVCCAACVVLTAWKVLALSTVPSVASADATAVVAFAGAAGLLLFLSGVARWLRSR